MTTKLSPYFTLEELTHSDTAVRLGITNLPTVLEIEHAKRYLIPGLDRVRILLGTPIHINSGFRSKRLNDVTPGSSDTSQHTKFEAADITSKDYGSPYTIAKALLENKDLIKFDQIIYEYKSWVHISFSRYPRGIITTKNTGSPYMQGLIK